MGNPWEEITIVSQRAGRKAPQKKAPTSSPLQPQQPGFDSDSGEEIDELSEEVTQRDWEGPELVDVDELTMALESFSLDQQDIRVSSIYASAVSVAKRVAKGSARCHTSQVPADDPRWDLVARDNSLEEENETV